MRSLPRLLLLMMIMMMSQCQGLIFSSKYTGTSFVLTRQPTFFLGNAVIEHRGSCPCRSYSMLTMRKQKASDRRTRRRQRGEIALEETAMPVTATKTVTTLTAKVNPMQNAAWKHKSGIAVAPLPTSASPQPLGTSSSGGRGRSRKRTTLYQTLQHYHSSFVHPLTAEYQAEVRTMEGGLRQSFH